MSESESDCWDEACEECGQHYTVYGDEAGGMLCERCRQRAEQLQQQFDQLTREWQAVTCWQSSIHDITAHPSYQRIIDMGSAVVPLIIREMERKRAHWFSALKAITGADPVPPADRGSIAAMHRHWLKWAAENVT